MAQPVRATLCSVDNLEKEKAGRCLPSDRCGRIWQEECPTGFQSTVRFEDAPRPRRPPCRYGENQRCWLLCACAVGVRCLWRRPPAGTAGPSIMPIIRATLDALLICGRLLPAPLHRATVPTSSPPVTIGDTQGTAGIRRRRVFQCRVRGTDGRLQSD